MVVVAAESLSIAWVVGSVNARDSTVLRKVRDNIMIVFLALGLLS